MIVQLICSFSGSCKQLSCPVSFPTDSLTKQLAVEEQLLNDYVRSVQRTAYINVYTDYAYTQPIRCFIKYHHFFRVVTADPQDTLSSVVLVALKVNPWTCYDPSTLYELIIGTSILCV